VAASAATSRPPGPGTGRQRSLDGDHGHVGHIGGECVQVIRTADQEADPASERSCGHSNDGAGSVVSVRATELTSRDNPLRATPALCGKLEGSIRLDGSPCRGVHRPSARLRRLRCGPTRRRDDSCSDSVWPGCGPQRSSGYGRATSSWAMNRRSHGSRRGTARIGSRSAQRWCGCWRTTPAMKV
jgi:hypothetical protein